MRSWGTGVLRVVGAAVCAFALIALTADPSIATAKSETTGGVTNTWTDYTTASGTEGPSIPSNTTVDITCRVTGFQVQDGNTWWYQVGSSPWNNVYYASADAFYNNGQTSGSLAGTPFYDPAVPVCASSSPGGPPTSGPAPSSTASTAQDETTGGVAHTWTNYLTAGGTPGPSIAANQTVQVTCRVTGFAVADGNTWWYQIASAPWSGTYYASADAFYNNGETSGSLVGTPFVDPAVPTCGSTAPPAPGLPLAPPSAPTLAQSANAALVQGVVLVSAPPNASNTVSGADGTGITKGSSFVSLTQRRRIPIGSLIDAERGTFELTVASGLHHTRAVRLSGGVFTLSQSGTGLHKGLTTFTLVEGSTFPNAPSTKGCAIGGNVARIASGRAAPGRSSRVLQILKAHERHGSFRTVGDYSAATVRGTSWSTIDRCDGTVTDVQSGIVEVRDFARGRTITVRAGHTYLARAVTTRR